MFEYRLTDRQTDRQTDLDDLKTRKKSILQLEIKISLSTETFACLKGKMKKKRKNFVKYACRGATMLVWGRFHHDIVVKKPSGDYY